jgi:UDP-N-acetylglucosamine 2-epimerase
MIGNSSSAIREGSFIRVPAVNIGNRQQKRLQGKNILNVGYNRKEIVQAVRKCLESRKPDAETIYGNGDAGKKIAEILAELYNISAQKCIQY